jgi:hypothetical protein
MDNENPNDVVPDGWLYLLMIGWLLLVGGRWVATPIIMFGDPLLADTVSNLDRGPLLRCYLILLVLTLMVPALRFARSIEQMVAASKRRGQSRPRDTQRDMEHSEQ